MQNGGPNRRPPLRPLHLAFELGPSGVRSRRAPFTSRVATVWVQGGDLHQSTGSGFGWRSASSAAISDNHVHAVLSQSRILVVVLLSVFTCGQQSGESSSRAPSKPTQQPRRTQIGRAHV